jgi:hypothetical protein
MNKISSMLDAVADSLEAKGLVKEAYEIDKVADAVEAFAIDPRQQENFEFKKKLKRTPGSVTHNETIVLPNGLSFSIQGSSTHYCAPKKNSPDPTIYTEYEVAVGGPKETSNFLVIPGFEKEANPYENNIMAYKPPALVEKIYQAAKKLTPEQVNQLTIQADQSDEELRS